MVEVIYCVKKDKKEKTKSTRVIKQKVELNF